MDTTNFLDAEKMAENMLMQAQLIFQHVKDIKEIHQEIKTTQFNVKKSEENIMKVGSFVVDFFNEYREHDALTMAQVKEMKQAQHYVTSSITKILCPTMEVIRKRGSEYLVEWNRVNKGIWSIYKKNVNGVNIPYDRTPKVKFNQALAYMKSLTIADYLAYRDERWGDIKKFVFNESVVEEKLTIENVIKVCNSSENEMNPNLKLLD